MKTSNLFFSGFYVLGLVVSGSSFAEKTSIDAPTMLSDRYISTKKSQTERAIGLSRNWMEANQKPFINAEGRVVYVYGVTMPVLVCKPRMVCDIQLQKGEKLLGADIGDKARWSYSDGISKKNGNKHHHISVKPKMSDLETNIIIETDRRTYNVLLKSSDLEFLPMIAFSYNDDGHIDVKDKNKSKNDLSSIESANKTVIDGKEVLGSSLDFEYNISGDKPKWKPVRVLNNGRKTLIYMPKSVDFGELPSLLIRDSDTKGSIINHRYDPATRQFNVDAVFDSAMLVAGTGFRQDKVIITRKYSDKDESYLDDILETN